MPVFQDFNGSLYRFFAARWIQNRGIDCVFTYQIQTFVFAFEPINADDFYLFRQF